jgi:hypothetical protein
MNADDGIFPTFPPGFHRRIMLQPGPGFIGGALEDDMHRFHIRLDHADGRITAVTAKAVRHPWSACPGATGFIAKELTGAALAEVVRRDPSQHCTHLLDLAIVSAAHASDTAPTRFDMRVADRVEGRTTATLQQDGVERLRWQLDGSTIVGSGLDLRELSKWRRELPAHEAEWATLLRRTIYVSGARQYVPPPHNPTAAESPERMGVCFNYQMPQAEASRRNPNWHQDFSESGREPLEGLDAEEEFAEMGGTR